MGVREKMQTEVSEIYYARDPIFKTGAEPQSQVEFERDFVKVRSLPITDLNDIYSEMQGEKWSPNGEARPLIQKLGLSHTSMSIGDLVKQKSILYVVASVGFEVCAMWDSNGQFLAVDFGADRERAKRYKELFARQEKESQ